MSYFHQSIPHRSAVIIFFFVLILLLLESGMTPAAGQSYEDGPEEGQGSEKVGPTPPESDRYAIIFKGNKGISTRKLKKAAADELADCIKSGLKEPEADDAAFQLESTYRTSGYAFASVTYSYGRQGKKKTLIFVFFEGPRMTINTVNISGLKAFEPETILRFVYGKDYGLPFATNPVFVEADVRAALSEITDFYRSEGFLEIKIAPPFYRLSEDTGKVDIDIDINEGQRFIIKSIEFSGDIPADVQNRLSKITEEFLDQTYYNRRKVMIRSRIGELYGNKGFPDVSTEVETHAGDMPYHIDLTVRISSGPRVVISDISIAGNIKTKNSFILDRLSLSKGDIYSQQKKRTSFRALYQTGLFSKINIDLKQGSDPESRILAISVEEQPSRDLFGEISWGSYTLLTGKIGYREINLLGTGRSFRSELGASMKGENVLVGITDPWLFQTGMTVDVPVYYQRREEPTFIRRDAGVSVFFSRAFEKFISINLGYLYRTTDIYDFEADAVPDDLESNYAVAGLKYQLSYDSRNDLFFPASGTKSFIAIEISEKFLGSELAFYKATAGYRYFWGFMEKTVLGFRYDTGFIIPGSDETTVPLGERFYNGGENSVRSYRDGRLSPRDESGVPLGGLAMNIISIEWRYNLYPGFVATIFADLGNISPNSPPAGKKTETKRSRSELIDDTFSQYFRDFRGAVGIGFQYLLPVGPLRLDFAMNPFPKEEEGEDKYNIHFSVGVSF